VPSPAPAAPAAGFDHRLADAIARRISEPRYNLWFRDHTRFVPLGDAVVVGVPNLYFHDWLQKTFGADVRAAADAREQELRAGTGLDAPLPDGRPAELPSRWGAHAADR
jgi:hypothetical protein